MTREKGIVQRFSATVVVLAALLSVASRIQAGEQDAATLRAYCETELTAPAPVCDCLLDKFEVMTEGQQAQLGASLRKDDAAATAARAGLTADEALHAGTFLARETPVCWPG